MSAVEIKIYGISACLKFVEKKSSQIVRAYFSENVSKKFSHLMKQMAKDKKVYRIVPEVELEKITQSKHHEGVCMVVKFSAPIKMQEYFSVKRKKDIVLFLENISNPHNLGAIMRVCSHFGVSAVFHSSPKLLSSGSAIRTSEGGFESLVFVECNSLKQLSDFAHKNNYKIYSTSSHSGVNFYQCQWPSKVILFFGEEKSGLSSEAFSYGDCVKIPGTGHVESLNVATAVAVILAEVWKHHSPRPT